MDNKLIVKKPIITEKSLSDAGRNIFTFEVDTSSTKPEIRQAIEDLFKVHVERIASVVRIGKKRLVGKKRLSVLGSPRKMVKVRVRAGEKIDLFEVGKKS